MGFCNDVHILKWYIYEEALLQFFFGGGGGGGMKM